MIPDKATALAIAEAHCAAWTNRNADAVTARYAEDATMGMNGGEPLVGRAEIVGMATGFMADFPDLELSLDSVLVADHHMIYAWTFEGHHRDTGRFVRFSGWEEWDLDEALNVTKSLGWFDAVDYERQVNGE